MEPVSYTHLETVNTVAGLKYHTVFGYFQNTLHRTGSKGLVITIDPVSYTHLDVYKRQERIYEKVCGYDAEGDSRVVTELIRRVRKKLAEYTQTEYIETVLSLIHI